MAPTSLPTPAPSTEILPGKRASLTAHIDSLFSLPPAAIASNASDTISAPSPSPVNSDSSYRPLSPPPVPASATSRPEKPPVATRKRGSAATNQANAANQNGYTLPPPPTRTRKIIQMSPRGQTGAHNETLNLAMNHTAIAQSPQASSSKTATTAAGSKRKQPSSGPTTAAGRKIARKTAHSLIERRRRSKMNEEFGVLKDMIPACHGQDMHKLAILQASIEYMRYLEQCLTDLKSAHSHCRPTSSASQQHHQAPFQPTPYSNATTAAGSAIEGGSESDEEMGEPPSPRSMLPRSSIATTSRGHSQQQSISPAILPSSHNSPMITGKHRPSYSHYSDTSSALPSPSFEPQTQAGGPSYSSFSLTSPTLGPQESGSGSVEALEQVDHEATAALLMLNTDRRSWSGPNGGRGMSVKDLLSG